MRDFSIRYIVYPAGSDYPLDDQGRPLGDQRTTARGYDVRDARERAKTALRAANPGMSVTVLSAF